MLVRLLCVILGLLLAQRSFADKLPLKDGDYANIDVACNDAPMAVRSVIISGEPLYSPQHGECENRVEKKSGHVYIVTPKCVQSDPPVARYTIIKSTEFELWTEYGQVRRRWCNNR
jgi:hypothetical protein